MATLKETRRRIGSVKNTQKITRAMKMVAAARLRRSQEAVQSFRGYADLIQGMLAEVAATAESKDHPLLARREAGKSLVVVICSDRGLCGGFNGNLCRDVQRRLSKRNPQPSLAIVGRKGSEFFRRRPVEVFVEYKDVYHEMDFASATRIAGELAQRYAAKEFDRIELAYNEFASVVSQKPILRELLPVVLPKPKDDHDERKALEPVGFIFEPGREQLLRSLLPRYVEVQLYRALLESVAAENAARMTAMDAATNNAADMIDHLTLVYNRARQSAITSELMDIVGGAEALHE